MEALRDRYREYLAVLNYAGGTIKGHIFCLKRFFRYLKDNNILEITAVGKEAIRAYQTHLFEEINNKGVPNSVFYQNNNLKVVKSFFRFLCKHDYLVSDPTKDIPYAKEPQRLPRSVLTQTEMRLLLHSPDTKTVLGYRDRTILEILYSTGIRKEELLNILLIDVDYADGFIRINNGKGGKDRIVPLGKIACRYVENYIKAVRSSLIKDPHNNYLFLSFKGNRLSKSQLGEIVKRYAKKAKIKKDISPHTFRHTCATLMLRNKANIRHIQELLGHASLDSTQIYTSVSITDLKEVHSKCHPREREND